MKIYKNIRVKRQLSGMRLRYKQVAKLAMILASIVTIKKVTRNSNVVLIGENDQHFRVTKREFIDTKEIDEPHENCPSSRTNWDEVVEPRYTLDPDKFMLPVLWNGPNNQILGFQQSILVAILLNRTLILPPFYKHADDGVEFRPLVDASHRLNVNKLRKLLSVVPVEQAVPLCNGKIEGIIMPSQTYPRASYLPRIGVRVHLETGLQFTNYKVDMNKARVEELKNYFYHQTEFKDKELASWVDGQKNFEWIDHVIRKEKPISADRISNLPSNTQPNVENLRAAYATNKTCVVYIYPFRQLGYFKPLPDRTLLSGHAKHLLSDPTLNVLTKEDGNILNTEIFRNIEPPFTINNFFEKFRDDMILSASPEGYLAMHWRYDDEDFFTYLCEAHSKNQRNTFCQQIYSAKNSTRLALIALGKIAEIKTFTNKEIKAVYFASPPSMASFALSVKNEFHKLMKITDLKHKIYKRPNNNGVAFLTSDDLKDHLFETYRKCNWLEEEWLYDTLSILEMNICTQSTVFYFSKQSTWSKNILYKRSTLGDTVLGALDSSIVDDARKVKDDILYPD